MKLQTTKVYNIVDKAIKEGYTTISAQGSSRSGKTYNILIWLIVYCLRHKKTRLAIIRGTLPALKGSALIDFKNILISLGIYDEKKSFNKSDLIYTFPNGSWVEFYSADNEEKLRGRARDILYCNEASEISFIKSKQMRMRTNLFSIYDYNPSFSDDHWICELNKDPKTFHFISTYKDNPFLPQVIIDEIERLKHENKSLWRIYGLGLQEVIEGLIFK